MMSLLTLAVRAGRNLDDGSIRDGTGTLGSEVRYFPFSSLAFYLLDWHLVHVLLITLLT